MTITLDDKYTAEAGHVLLSGIQALVRLTLEQRRLDRRRGHDTAVFVSGYQGSPLAGVDRELQRASRHLDAEGIVFQPGLNEELAATAVGGTQLLGEIPGRRHDGVVGFWFGKNPGLDRAADAIRHANLSGTSPLGGAVAWIGDDPACKSSTVPSSCEPMCRSLLMPLLAPGSVSDLIGMGLHAVALSRYAGVWAGLKIVADIADATAVVDVTGILDLVPALPLRDRTKPPILLPPSNLRAEEDLATRRIRLAADYARLAGLNVIVTEPRQARVAVIAAGATYELVVRATRDLGLNDAALERLGVRLIKLGMIWPLDSEEIQRLTAGVAVVLVLEDKLPFVETAVKAALYNRQEAPVVVGELDPDGRPLRPLSGALTADDVARALGRVLHETLPTQASARLAAIEHATAAAAEGQHPTRTPYFCSGCPHNASTKADASTLVGVGIGCHTMIVLDTAGGRGQAVGMPQMGGEGAQWIGLQPFTDDDHFVQNLGDGTFHHSGSLAIRAAVAAGANITYKLLYNDAVAMTGGQRPEGRLDVPTLTRWLAAEGVRRVIVTTPEPDRYRGAALDPIAEVRHRDRLEEAQRDLASIPGATVLIHDDQCATEERRMRKRGALKAPAERVWINERVCEGCGDCGDKSTCLSVLPVETEFGRKTRIHQSSCNQDFSCLKGDCPSFLLVTPRDGASARASLPVPPADIPEPSMKVPPDVLVRMPGIGGTGVVTVSQVLQMAAHLEGRFAAGLEQIGLAQKGGPVVSDVRIASKRVEGHLRAASASADVILGFDLLGAASAGTLAVADPKRTIAVVSTSVVPTAEMITDVRSTVPSASRALRRIEAVTRAADNLCIDAQGLAERLFNDHMPSNMLLVGAAYQHGCLPVHASAIEEAIRLNGTAVELNVAAFRWGRAAVADLELVEHVLDPDPPVPPPICAEVGQIVDRMGAQGELRRVLELRLSDLIGYQNLAYANRYAAEVSRVALLEREQTADPDSPVAYAYASGLYKLMAYKDEYEVARLHLDAVEAARLRSDFSDAEKVRILLHPPMLRAMGLKRKLRFGPWIGPALRALYMARRVRGTVLDPFARAEVRKVERQLVIEYRALVDLALTHLNVATASRIADIAALPDMIRGYEHVKLANVERFRAQAEKSLRELEHLGELQLAAGSPPGPVGLETPTDDDVRAG